MSVANSQVHASAARLDATFERVKSISLDEPELRSDCSRYLCILVCGFLETSVVSLIVSYAETNAHPRVARMAERKLAKTTNLKAEKLAQFIGHLDAEWEQDLRDFMGDERKAAIDSLVDLRHQIAHGGQAGISLVNVSEYWKSVREVVDFLAGYLEP